MRSGGYRGGMAAVMLRNLGRENVHNVLGGK
jgi:rhodanese-related sulfurtransferase